MSSLEELLDIEKKAQFENIWGKNDNIGDSPVKWEAINELFFNSQKWIKKERNIWHNELRERALFTIFTLPDNHVLLNGNENLKNLKLGWISLLNSCIEEWCTKNGKELSSTNFNQLAKLAGRKYKWDFELRDTVNKEIIKIEFKFSASGSKSIKQLAQFNAINTESKSAIEVFKGESNCYLEYFWDNGFSEMCETVSISKPGNKNDWKKTAKVTNPPDSAKPEMKVFHQALRDLSDKTVIASKKQIVNSSFDSFIKKSLPVLNELKDSKLKELFESQENKFYCIFTNGVFYKDMIPPFSITNVIQSTAQKHAFIINTDLELYDIKADMSWGNGGAGNNNPRIKFGLISKGEDVVEESDEDDNEELPPKKKKRTGGGETEMLITSDIENEDKSLDEDPLDQEYAEGDPINDIIDGLSEKSESVIDIDKNDFIELRSGKLVPKIKSSGGSKKTKRKTKLKTKRNKKRKSKKNKSTNKKVKITKKKKKVARR